MDFLYGNTQVEKSSFCEFFYNLIQLAWHALNWAIEVQATKSNKKKIELKKLFLVWFVALYDKKCICKYQPLWPLWLCVRAYNTSDLSCRIRKPGKFNLHVHVQCSRCFKETISNWNAINTPRNGTNMDFSKISNFLCIFTKQGKVLHLWQFFLVFHFQRQLYLSPPFLIPSHSIILSEMNQT